MLEITKKMQFLDERIYFFLFIEFNEAKIKHLNKDQSLIYRMHSEKFCIQITSMGRGLVLFLHCQV